MTNRALVILLLCLLFFPSFISVVHAEGATLRPNNIFCLHLNQFEEDTVRLAREIVNSTGGDWGCVIATVTKKDRINIDTWKQNMNFLRRNHLAVMLRIATEPCGGNWCPGTVEDADEVAQFLSKLNPPTQSDNVVQIFNEINDRREWGGKVDPEGAAPIIKAYIDKIHEKAPRFKIGFGAFNPTAGPPHDMDEREYVTRMINVEKNLFDNVDFWISHSYSPSGPVDSYGRRSVRAYQWELNYLKSLGVKDMKVIIGETGRPHAEGATTNNSYVSVSTLDNFWRDVFSIAQSDPRIVKVGAFIAKDCDQFSHYSWFDCQTKSFWPFVDTVKAIPKVKGEPEQKQLFNVSAMLPKEMTVNSTYNVFIKLTNGGQAWIDVDDGYRLGMLTGTIKGAFTQLTDMQPGTYKTINFNIKTGNDTGDQCGKVGLFKDDTPIVELFKWCFTVSAPSSLDIIGGALGQLEAQFFDRDEQLVFRQKIMVGKSGGHIDEVKNVIIGDTYRVVAVKDYHLPTQKFVKISKGLNTVQLDPMLPIDFNNDGQFTLSDLLSIKNKFISQ